MQRPHRGSGPEERTVRQAPRATPCGSCPAGVLSLTGASTTRAVETLPPDYFFSWSDSCLSAADWDHSEKPDFAELLSGFLSDADWIREADSLSIACRPPSPLFVRLMVVTSFLRRCCGFRIVAICAPAVQTPSVRSEGTPGFSRVRNRSPAVAGVLRSRTTFNMFTCAVCIIGV